VKLAWKNTKLSLAIPNIMTYMTGFRIVQAFVMRFCERLLTIKAEGLLINVKTARLVLKALQLSPRSQCLYLGRFVDKRYL
jgi:hypothetical protein